MLRGRRRAAALVTLFLSFALSLTACDAIGLTGVTQGSSAQPAESQQATQEPEATATVEPTPTPTPEPPTVLQILLPAPAGGMDAAAMQPVLDAFAKQSEGKLNVELNFTFEKATQLAKVANQMITAGSQLDCVYMQHDAKTGLEALASAGKLEPLEEYLEGDEYPALHAAFDEALLNANTSEGADGQQHLFGLPLGRSFADAGVIYYRQDLLQKAGGEAIASYDDLVAFLGEVGKLDAAITPFSWPGAVQPLSGYLPGLMEPTPGAARNLATAGGVSLAIGTDGRVYGSALAVPGKDPAYAALLSAAPADPMQGYKLAREWFVKGYVSKAISTVKDSAKDFTTGKAAAFPSTLADYSAVGEALKAVPGAQLGCFVTEAGLSTGTPGSVAADYRAKAFLSLPADSVNKPKMLAFLNWMYEDAANHDLFELGVPGVNWNDAGDGKFSRNGAAPYAFPADAFTANPKFSRIEDTTPVDVADAMKKLADPAILYQAPLSGFAFKPAVVKAEHDKAANLNAMLLALGNGTVADYTSELASLQAQYDAAGFAKLRDEVVKQATQYLADHPVKTE